MCSIFPGWVFTAADAAAGFGMHAGLLLGTKKYAHNDHESLLREPSSFGVELESGDVIRRGSAKDVLGGPLAALRYLIDELARHSVSEPLRRGELISTGTLTDAMPAVPGVTWSVRFAGVDLQPLCARLV